MCWSPLEHTRTVNLTEHINLKKFRSTTRSVVNKSYYFIPSGEFNAYLKYIKVILSVVKQYCIFSYDLYFFTVANRGCSGNLGLNFFQKRFIMHRFCLTLRNGSITSNKVNNTFRSLLSLHNTNLHATSVRRQFQAAFCNRKCLYIHSLK